MEGIPPVVIQDPYRVLANTMALAAWRNGPVEDTHAGLSSGYSLNHRRASERQIHEVSTKVNKRCTSSGFETSACVPRIFSLLERAISPTALSTAVDERRRLRPRHPHSSAVRQWPCRDRAYRLLPTLYVLSASWIGELSSRYFDPCFSAFSNKARVASRQPSEWHGSRSTEAILRSRR